MKKNWFFETKYNLVRRTALFYIFANLFNVWLNKRQLGFQMYFCIQFVLTHCSG